ncbi:hypothetical protein EB796_013030 [Bugula neritina]|uniref:Uncharacterized protein n=1 Tax=Bugula neritina TaxID=10212 RepID=A0A7J7JQP0_BUGNE|nr:hypothetical protein EB796_013030 [Bugula neritina]
MYRVDLPVKASSAVTPIDHMSAAFEGAFLCSSSGALYLGVPAKPTYQLYHMSQLSMCHTSCHYSSTVTLTATTVNCHTSCHYLSIVTLTATTVNCHTSCHYSSFVTLAVTAHHLSH